MPPHPARLYAGDSDEVKTVSRSDDDNNNMTKNNNNISRGVAFPDSFKIEDESGLWIHLDNSTGNVSLKLEPCAHFRKIHPNCYAPSVFEQDDLKLLKGGGSGATVFGGTHPEYGPLVMKHGGYKDTKEVMALASIRNQLNQRSHHAAEAVNRMNNRIPDFVGVYLTRHHVRDRATELWNTLRASSLDTIFLAQQRSENHNRRDSEYSVNVDIDDGVIDMNSKSPSARAKLQRERAKSMRDLCVQRGEDIGFEVQFKQVLLHIPDYSKDGIVPNGFEFLDDLAEELSKAQSENFWKLTLAQTTIGGKTSKNGAQCLYDGELEGSMLDLVVKEYVLVIKDLRCLTSESERQGLDDVRAQVEQLQAEPDVSKVSKTVDMFCGNAIRKNYMPNSGRFAYLRNIAKKFNERRFNLCEDEKLPASFLGYILRQDSDLNEVFVTPPSAHSVLDYYYDSKSSNNWLELLKHATELTHASATDRIWTCGLTDAGLHNTFLSKERGLELFDLGEPQVVTQPAFLTKFLMSFFHSLGMQEVDEKTSDANYHETLNYHWITRFEVKSGRLDLTKASKELIPYTCQAFNQVVDAIVRELFDNDPDVKKLLLKYTIMQVLSDTAFCLQRWEQKGGGKERFNDRAERLGHWLWRALWDVYIASYVHTHMLMADK